MPIKRIKVVSKVIVMLFSEGEELMTFYCNLADFK